MSDRDDPKSRDPLDFLAEDLDDIESIFEDYSARSTSPASGQAAPAPRSADDAMAEMLERRGKGSSGTMYGVQAFDAAASPFATAGTAGPNPDPSGDPRMTREHVDSPSGTAATHGLPGPEISDARPHGRPASRTLAGAGFIDADSPGGTSVSGASRSPDRGNASRTSRTLSGRTAGWSQDPDSEELRFPRSPGGTVAGSSSALHAELDAAIEAQEALTRDSAPTAGDWDDEVFTNPRVGAATERSTGKSSGILRRPGKLGQKAVPGRTGSPRDVAAREPISRAAGITASPAEPTPSPATSSKVTSRLEALAPPGAPTETTPNPTAAPPPSPETVPAMPALDGGLFRGAPPDDDDALFDDGLDLAPEPDSTEASPSSLHVEARLDLDGDEDDSWPSEDEEGIGERTRVGTFDEERGVMAVDAQEAGASAPPQDERTRIASTIQLAGNAFDDLESLGLDTSSAREESASHTPRSSVDTDGVVIESNAPPVTGEHPVAASAGPPAGASLALDLAESSPASRPSRPQLEERKPNRRPRRTTSPVSRESRPSSGAGLGVWMAELLLTAVKLGALGALLWTTGFLDGLV
ncbi:MAG: hypothetical protein EA398_11935 [Deltaproteobacteria bacterium]|nr:MAG: hypothetical protein EA398_11935 [Deltaproteobacteria bacterium]